MAPIDYTKTCFVIMPFGTKPVGKHKVNFDRIYEEIFGPAIGAVALSEGGKLRPVRTDKEFYAGSSTRRCSEYLEPVAFRARGYHQPQCERDVRDWSPARRPTIGTAIFRQGDARFLSISTTSRPFLITTDRSRTRRRHEHHPESASRLPRTERVGQSRAGRTESPTGRAAERSTRWSRCSRCGERAAGVQPPGRHREAQGALHGKGNALIHVRLGILLRDQGAAGGGGSIRGGDNAPAELFRRLA